MKERAQRRPKTARRVALALLCLSCWGLSGTCRTATSESSSSESSQPEAPHLHTSSDLSAGGERVATAQERLEGHFPNIRLETHEGREVRFYDDLIRGRVVLINFMYTRCDGI